MAKSARKPSPKKESDSTSSIEDTVIGIASGVSKVANEYKIPIIAGIVVLIGMIGLFGLYRTFKESQQLAWNADVHEFFLGSADEIRKGYPALLEEYEGVKIEPYVVVRVANWLCSQDKPEDNAEATRIVRNTLVRLPTEPLLLDKAAHLEKAADEDRDFTVPEPRPEPATVPLPVGEQPEKTVEDPPSGSSTGDGSVPTDPPAESDSNAEKAGPPPVEDADTGGAGEKAGPPPVKDADAGGAGDGGGNKDGAGNEDPGKTEDPPKEKAPPTNPPGSGNGGDGAKPDGNGD